MGEHLTNNSQQGYTAMIIVDELDNSSCPINKQSPIHTHIINVLQPLSEDDTIDFQQLCRFLRSLHFLTL